MDSDRERWNQRYCEGAYVARPHPTSLLENWLARLPHAYALDIACGSGRNSRFIAQSAEQVIGVDISDIAILQARELSAGLENVHFLIADLENGLPLNQKFDLLVLVRFVNLELIQQLQDFLVPGGTVLVEEHLQWDEPDLELAGPKNPNYRVAPGALTQALSSFECMHSYEGLVHDPLGELSALAQFIGRKF